ncbi:uncharacterized protein LOC134867469 [Eleginops maclovinus]|uniref:uncharacterized protein LOC134867469 n=1 Tax=Eleginops maclovinus TaxID=56733 RepID=UPI00308062CF
MSAGTRSGKGLRKNTTALKNKMLPSASAVINHLSSVINLESGGDDSTDIPNVSKSSKDGNRSGKVPRKNQTAAKKDKTVPATSTQTFDINLDSGDDSTDTPHVSNPKKDRSPTVKNLLQMAKMRERSQNKKLQKVIKERDALRKQLAYLSKAAKEDSSEEDTASCSSNSSSMSQSSSCSSSSSSSDDDDDDKMRRKGKGKAKLRLTKNKKKMKKHHKADVRKRARGPFEVIRRYKKVLKAYNRGLKLSAACAYAGVNELTVRSTASIAELATASPAEFTKLLEQAKQAKLKDVAVVCENYIKGDVQIQTKVGDLKSQCQLIPYGKRA